MLNGKNTKENLKILKLDMIEVYTLGTSNRSIEEFLDILKFYKIEVVIDVRRFPTSRLFPHFKKESLKSVLGEKGIDYFCFEKLGGFREEGYEAYMETEEFNQALGELIQIAENKNTIIICAERLPWKCHRAFIARELENKKFKLIHIIEKDRIWRPEKEPKEIKPSCQKRLRKEEDLKSREN